MSVPRRYAVALPAYLAALLAVDVARGQERRSNAIHTDPVFLREIAHAPEFFDGRIDAVPRDFGIAADITDPVPREVFQMGVIGRSALAP